MLTLEWLVQTVYSTISLGVKFSSHYSLFGFYDGTVHIHQIAVGFIMRIKNTPLHILLKLKDDKFLQAKLCSVMKPLSNCPGMFTN